MVQVRFRDVYACHSDIVSAKGIAKQELTLELVMRVQFFRKPSTVFVNFVLAYNIHQMQMDMLLPQRLCN